MSIFEKWLIVCLVLVFLALPTLLVISKDMGKEMSLQMIMIPITIAWGLLVLAQLYAWYRIRKYYRRVKTLHLTSPKFRLDPAGADSKNSAPVNKVVLNSNVRLSPTTTLPITKEFF